MSRESRHISTVIGAEIVFSLRRAPGVDDDGFERDAAMVSADLTRLTQLLEP